MKILIAEDDLTSRMFMKKFLSRYGVCDIAVNGIEAIELTEQAIVNRDHYHLICLDVMMPKIDGVKALREIRRIEEKMKQEVEPAKVIMTTALNDRQTVDEAYEAGCHAYAWKPINIHEFKVLLENLDLI